MDEFELPRIKMVERLRDHYNIADQRVLEAMAALPRHAFVPEALRSQAYKDNALPIAGGQTISQPFIVARMTELLELNGTERVLEIGAGSGYQTALLAMLVRKVYAIERIESLAVAAREKLRSIGINNFTIKVADGTTGWPVYAPFDAILVAAGGPRVPEPLVEQLVVGGRLVIPIGANPRSQVLVRVTKTEGGYDREDCGPCSFVPLIGAFGWQKNGIQSEF